MSQERVKYSKKRMINQSRTKSLKYMAPLAAGTVLTIVDVVENSFDGRDGEVMNDFILCHDEEQNQIKVPVREYAKMEKEGEAFESEGSADEILLPSSITIKSSENRKYTPQGGEEQELFPVYSYNRAEEFVAGSIEFDDLVNSGVSDKNTFKPVQNYSVICK